jgi:hypothetical protein
LRAKHYPEDPLEDLKQMAQRISMGLSAKELKRFSEEERLKAFYEKKETSLHLRNFYKGWLPSHHIILGEPLEVSQIR